MWIYISQQLGNGNWIIVPLDSWDEKLSENVLKDGFLQISIVFNSKESHIDLNRENMHLGFRKYILFPTFKENMQTE